MTAPLATTPPTNSTPKPPRRPKTPPIPARTARIVMPVGRAAAAGAALAGGVHVVDGRPAERAAARPAERAGARGRIRCRRGRGWGRVCGCLIGHLGIASLDDIRVGSVPPPSGPVPS